MDVVNDTELMREYLDRQSESAFAELVQRHINLVYSVALRYARNPQDAQDVTQAVFTILAGKIHRLRQRSTLTGWLYETTRLAAGQLLRTKTRQQARDHEAYMQSILQEPEAQVLWREIEPILEEAMSRLHEKERAVLALRFFENKTIAETAALLGLREWAARKKISRAIEKLQKFFGYRGVTSSAEAITRAISSHSIQPAPALLAKTVTTIALAKGATASASTLTLIQGALKLMAWTKVKTAIVATTAVVFTAGVTPYVWHYHLSSNSWHYRFDAAYDLRHGELIRRITPPFIPERLTFYRTSDPLQAQAIPKGPDLAIFKQDKQGKLRWATYSFGSSQTPLRPRQTPLRQVLGTAFGFKFYEFEGPDNLLNLTVIGDWTISKGLTNRDTLFTALEPILFQATKRHITFDKQTVERDVIVVSGNHFTVPSDHKIQGYAEKTNDQSYENYGDLNEFLADVGQRIYLRFVNESEVQPNMPEIQHLTWVVHSDFYVPLANKRRDELIDEILKHLSEQTGLTFTRAQRPVDVWFVSAQK